MASKETWAKLRYFRPDSTDKFGDPDAIDDSLMLRLDDFRHFLGVALYITSGVRASSPGKSSYHTREKGACAVDLVAPGYEGNQVDLIFAAMRFGFSGIGYYPDWKYLDKRCGGLHLDTRPIGMDADGTLNYGHSLWMGIKEGGKLAYVGLSYENIIKYSK